LTARRHRTLLAVLFVDMDHFKRINDSLGHTIADELLKSIARRLVACVRTTDTVSRHGGMNSSFCYRKWSVQKTPPSAPTKYCLH
jgi:diguanylate cyclase (GGDEF)-like protein